MSSVGEDRELRKEKGAITSRGGLCASGGERKVVTPLHSVWRARPTV